MATRCPGTKVHPTAALQPPDDQDSCLKVLQQLPSQSHPYKATLTEPPLTDPCLNKTEEALWPHMTEAA